MGRRLPQLDLQQDWMLSYSREENNVTTLRFYRQRDTNDSANDTVIQVTRVIFVCHSVKDFLKTVIQAKMIVFVLYNLFNNRCNSINTKQQNIYLTCNIP